MDANGNQRKRAGRLAKNTNNNESISPNRNSEGNEVMEVSAVAISPTLEEADITTNPPVAECRRSSRKKIIKFDVRDLLNKNRKTHKIQIEARIDSNAPATSKASIAESTNSKTSSTVREDLLSKQKTFLEKSAIFRRYSISQEHKPPPPPLPIPPLLGKASDNNEAGLSGASTNRRLSRTQEFFSNVMIKPKQTTSLIVAQIESNTPSSSSTTAKRKNLNKSLELETKVVTSVEIESSPILQQKKRGRPAKFKTPTLVESNASPGVQENVTKKQITPEKAKNWKEYKACLAQQSSSTNVEIETKNSQNKEADNQLKASKSKQDLSTDILINIEETSQSDISKSDDDGNFSGFQTSKDDISCDSPVLENVSLEKENENRTAISENIIADEKAHNEAKTSAESEEKELPIESDSFQQNSKTGSINIEVSVKQKLTQEIANVKQSPEMESQSQSDIVLENIIQSSDIKSEESDINLERKVEKITPITETKTEFQYKSIDLEQSKSDEKSDVGYKDETVLKQSIEFSQKQGTEETNAPKEDVIQTEFKSDKCDKSTSTATKETETPEIMAIRSKYGTQRKEDNNDLSQENQTNVSTSKNKSEEFFLESNKKIEEDKQEKPTASSKIMSEIQTLETQPELTRKLKTPDIIKATKIIDECSPDTKLTTSDILLITSQLRESQPTTPSEETMKSFSRNSSSSESENASYSSEPASTSSSSSSSRSYKSGDKLRVSLKRISLPKSPSTSSQTSTSEELNSSNNPEVTKKKPPMAKRSKRLQKKFVEMLGNKDETENIDDCFKRISNEELNSTEQDSIEGDNFQLENKNIKETCTETAKDCNKEINSAEKVTKISSECLEKDAKTVLESLDKEPIKQDLKQKALKSPITSEDIDSLSNDSSTTTTQPDKEKIQKYNSSIGKRKSLRNRKDNSSDDKETEKVSDVQDLKQKETTSKEIEGITQEKLEEIPIDVGIQTAGESDQSDETKDKQKRKITHSQPTKQLQRKLKIPSSRVEDQKSNNDDKTKITEEMMITVNIEVETRSEEQVKNLENSAKAESITESTVNIVESSLKKSDQQETTCTRSKTNKEKSTVLLDNFSESEVIEKAIEGAEDNPAEIKSPITDKLDKVSIITPTKSRTNKEELSARETENVFGIETTKTILKDETIFEISKAEVSQSSDEKEIATTNAKELDDNGLENTRKVIVTSQKTNIGEYSTIETKNEKEEPFNQKLEKPTEQDKDSTNIDIKPELMKVECSEKITESNTEEITSIKETNISEESADNIKGNIVLIPTTEVIKSSISINIDTSDNKKEKPNKKAVTKGKTNKEEADTINRIRSRSKKLVETPDASNSSEKITITDTQETEAKLSNIIKTQENTESSKTIGIETQETIATETAQLMTCTKVSKSSSPIQLTDKPLKVSETSLETFETSETVITEPCHSTSDTKDSIGKDSPSLANQKTNSAIDTEKPTTDVTINKDSTSSPKKKSLRNQKDKDTTEEFATQIQESEITTDIEKALDGKSVTSTKLEQTQDKDTVKVPKRRGRKSRFKNLHTPENESETDSSNGKNTPIDEMIQQKLKYQIILESKEKLEDKEQTKLVQRQQNIEKNSETLTFSEEKVNLKEKSKANLSSSQIQNVSIETNTLLDILRTVQSNTEAALKANKSATDSQKTNNEIAVSLVKTDVEESAKKLSKDLHGIPQEAKLTSPARSNTNSPLSLKRMPISPTRSESASPLTLKKVTQSPTRSDSSSPLTLKKVTRRYERRSRRGEDASHKTLEETFAEIAAESSKAVLAAKEFDINVEEDQIRDETPQSEVNYINTEMNAKDQIRENLSENDKSSLISEEAILKADEQVVTMEKILPTVLQPLEILDKTLNDSKPTETEVKNSEKIIESQESIKLTPTRRGRKPKNRPMDLEEKASSKINNETTVAKEEVENTQIVTETQEETKIDNKSNKSKNTKETIQTEISTENDSKILVIPPTSTQIESKESSDLTEATFESTLKHLDDKNDGKSNKKPFKKRDTFKTEVVPDDSINADVISTKEKEGEVHTPKQSSKKRDTSQTKSETKSTGKKLPKKTKSDEEDNSNLQKDTKSNTSTTTPPPSKRGRKPKNQQDTPQSTTSSKKKNKKDLSSDNPEGNINPEKTNTPESESESTSLDKSFDEKLAKKKRQKKLKEAFEAALTEDVEKSKEPTKAECSTDFGVARLNKSPTPPTATNDMTNESSKITCVTPVEAEEDPDPLKDIEKFIADGVNLLKKDYKLDEESVDDVITPKPVKTTEILEEPVKSSTEESEIQHFNTFETPADTPINTPSVTPPPKSPTSIESSTPDENSGVRRSHRIKLITKTPKALVGRGLVRDKERFSIKDDVETKSHYTLDDHLTDLAEVEAKNAKFLKEMEERLSNFQVIKENEYLCERVISREARKMICDCFLTQEEEERGELGCGEDCLNRLLMIECGPECNVKERCTNKRFQKLLCSPCRVFRTEKKGFGIMADIEILPGEFIMEYVGEVIDTDEFEKRRIIYSQDKNRHYYFMALRSDAIIDATIKGNISRFINHSCDPNAETQKWTVNGELRIGFFSRKSIMPGEEITFNYQYQRYGREAQRCYCESANCRGWIGQEPTSDEGEQIDEDDESEDDEEEEEADTSNLLVQDDDEDSDTSVADPEEVQKQLEMAAAQAEVELAPLQLLDDKGKEDKSSPDEEKSSLDIIKTESDEDSKSKFKKLLSKMAEKVAAKQKQTKREQKMQRKKKSKESTGDLGNKLRFLEDPDIEDEVEFLKECGLKNQSDTLRLSRLMVRAKLVQTRLNLLEILRKGDLPCRRLFLDYHGLRLLHGWMSEDAGNMQIRLALLQTLETLPIANKTVLTDSKVMQVVRNWCGNNTNLSPNEDSSSSNSNSQDVPATTTTNFEEGSELAELQKLGLKLTSTWEGLPEIFRIPKKERIEQMKEHEREADRQYAANAEIQQDNLTTDRYRRDRFGRGFNTTTPNSSNRFTKPNNGNPHRTANTTPENIKNLSKAQRREMFAAKVARDEAEKRLAEERREFETKCRFFGLDPKKTRPQDIPFCVNPATGQWFSIERKPITTPPSYAHVQVPVKPKSTDPNDYQLPAVCSTLPPQWKYAITPQGKIYYYHIKHRIPQWEPPSTAQLQECEMEAREEDSESELTTTAGEDSSDDDDDVLIGMDAAQLKAYIDRKVEMRRQKRYQRLVDERSISPRREEDRIYNQIEVRKYKENKEKIRKRKEEIRRRRAEALRQSSLNMCTLGSITETNTSSNKLPTESDEELGALPIQDYLLSSDEEVDLKAEVNSPLMDKIVEGDKIVDELDALTTKRQLKRPLPPHRDLSEASSSSASSSGLSTTISRQEYKKRKLEKKEKRKPKEQQDAKYRKNKEKFRCEIAGIIVHHLKPYRKDSCTVGRIQSNEDFNHLARKLTHFVMIKELKYCESVGQTLVVTESVKSKSREFIKKYMAKYGEVYVKPTNDPDFKDIPFTL